MFGVTINIDPHNSMDFEKALKFILDQPCMSKQREAYKQITSNPSQWVNKTELEKLITENNELKNIIKNKEIENERKDSSLKEKEEKIIELDNALKQNDERFNEEKQKLIQETLDALDKAEKIEEDAEQKIKAIEETNKQYLTTISNKEKEIQRLMKLLESYSVSFGSDNASEKTYFEVNDSGSLEESMISSDSLYCASRCGDIFKFSINTDDGPIKNAISNIEHDLAPFCEIKDNMEGANTIHIISIGKAKLMGSQLIVSEKAVVSLIKQ